MKNLLFILTIVLVGFSSCDKVNNPIPESVSQGDWDLYPNGDSAHYATNVWPTFSVNSNTNRNILLEDFTGHSCPYCPYVADTAHAISLSYPSRVMVSTVHTSPNGIGSFQVVDALHPHDFTNPNGIAIGQYFGEDWAGSNFIGNPKGMVSRAIDPSQPVLGPQIWRTSVNDLIAINELKVNIQSEANYYPSTRGIFLHTEIDLLDPALTNELTVVVQLHEDSMVSPQSYPGSGYDPNYVHRDIMRGCIDGKTFGESLNASNLDANGKYYVNYIYELPSQYDASNVHLLIYVRDAVTEEIYQVIKQQL